MTGEVVCWNDWYHIYLTDQGDKGQLLTSKKHLERILFVVRVALVEPKEWVPGLSSKYEPKHV